jgi:hypothetical protein
MPASSNEFHLAHIEVAIIRISARLSGCRINANEYSIYRNLSDFAIFYDSEIRMEKSL